MTVTCSTSTRNPVRSTARHEGEDSAGASTVLGGEGKVVPKSECPAQGETFPFQADVDSFLHVDCTRIPKQGGTLSFQTDVGMNPDITIPQVTVCQEFAKLSIGRQQRGVIASSTE